MAPPRKNKRRGKPAGATKARRTPLPKRMPPDEGPERRVKTFYRSAARAHPFGTSLMGSAALLGAIGAIYFPFVRNDPWPWAGWGCGAVALLMLGVMLGLKFAAMTTRLVVTNKRSIQKVGLISRDTSEVMHDAIRNFQIKQKWWQRLLGVGSIGISSAGQDGVEIHLHDMPNPDRIQRIIDYYRDSIRGPSTRERSAEGAPQERSATLGPRSDPEAD